MDVPGDKTCRNRQRPARPGPGLTPSPPVLAAPSRAGWRSWRNKPRAPRKGCGVRGRAPTPSVTSSTPSRTPGTSWTPCTRSQSMVSWHRLCPRVLGSPHPLPPACVGSGDVHAAGVPFPAPSHCRGWRRAGSGYAAPAEPLCSKTNLSFCTAAIIEHVRDGSVVRALLLPDYYLVTVMLSGIKVRLGRWLQPRLAGSALLFAASSLLNSHRCSLCILLGTFGHRCKGAGLAPIPAGHRARWARDGGRATAAFLPAVSWMHPPVTGWLQPVVACTPARGVTTGMGLGEVGTSSTLPGRAAAPAPGCRMPCEGPLVTGRVVVPAGLASGWLLVCGSPGSPAPSSAGGSTPHQFGHPAWQEADVEGGSWTGGSWGPA